jgi:hypothetical protein
VKIRDIDRGWKLTKFIIDFATTTANTCVCSKIGVGKVQKKGHGITHGSKVFDNFHTWQIASNEEAYSFSEGGKRKSEKVSE